MILSLYYSILQQDTKLLHTFAFDRHLTASNNYKTRRVNFFFLGRQKASCRYKNAKPKN